MTFTADEIDAWRGRIGPTGVWLTGAVRQRRADLLAAAAEFEALGYGALWIGGGSPDRQALADLEAVLERTERLVVATGIANIWAWEPAALHEAAAAIDEAHPGRFVLGLGVAHAALVPRYRRPLAAMREFLDGLDRAAEASGRRPFRVIAALRRRMLELARDRSGGSHPYFTPVEHTALARRTLGPAALLAPEVAVVVGPDAGRARGIAREYAAVYLQLPNYVENLRELGFGDADFAEGGSDRLVDALIPMGDADEVARRVREHLDAGADHVCVQPLGLRGDPGAAVDQLRLLAAALAGR
jgi:probable F420-dependent oxidoreductase